MELTPRFIKAVKYLLLFTAVMIAYSFVLMYMDMSGISISSPEENTDLRVLLNNLKGILMISASWVAIGYVTKDYKAAISALVVNIVFHFGVDHIYPHRGYGATAVSMRELLGAFTGMAAYLTFGFLHFRSSLAFKLLAMWAFSWGLGVAYDPHVFERMLEGLTRLIGIRDPFEFRISTGETSYRSTSLLRLTTNQVITLANFVVFWAIYRIIKNGKPLWEGLHTCHPAHQMDRLTYSSIYWSMRLVLFVTALGVTSYIARGMRGDFDFMSVPRVIAFSFAIVVLAAVYRNFLVADSVRRNGYPGSLFLLLNIPLINAVAYIYAMVTFSTGSDSDDIHKNISSLTARFTGSGKNTGWKVVVILLTLVSMVYQLDRAGFRIDGPSRDGAFWVLVTVLISFGLMVWYLFDRNSYVPLLMILAANIVLVVAVRSAALLQPTIATGIVNVVLYYGLFYFDELKWELPPAVLAPTEEE